MVPFLKFFREGQFFKFFNVGSPGHLSPFPLLMDLHIKSQIKSNVLKASPKSNFKFLLQASLKSLNWQEVVSSLEKHIQRTCEIENDG